MIHKSLKYLLSRHYRKMLPIFSLNHELGNVGYAPPYLGIPAMPERGKGMALSISQHILWSRLGENIYLINK